MVYKPGFPSGQRGWTQDPLRKASQVRILPPALLIKKQYLQEE